MVWDRDETGFDALNKYGYCSVQNNNTTWSLILSEGDGSPTDSFTIATGETSITGTVTITLDGLNATAEWNGTGTDGEAEITFSSAAGGSTYYGFQLESSNDSIVSVDNFYFDASPGFYILAQFNGTNGTDLDDYTTDTGQSTWVYELEGGDIELDGSGKIHLSTTSGDVFPSAALETTHNNVRVTLSGCTIPANNTCSVYVILRNASTDNRLEIGVRYLSGQHRLDLWEQVSGSYNSLGGTNIGTQTTGDIVVEAIGGEITISYAGFSQTIHTHCFDNATVHGVRIDTFSGGGGNPSVSGMTIEYPDVMALCEFSGSNGTNATTLEPEIGAAFTTGGTGSFLLDGSGKVASNGNSGYNYIYTTVGGSPTSVQADLTFHSSFQGGGEVIGWWVDASNYCRFGYNKSVDVAGNAPVLNLIKVSGGSFVASNSVGTDNYSSTTKTMRMATDGTNIYGYVDGELKLSIAAAPTAGDEFGMMVYQASGANYPGITKFDNFAVHGRPLPSAWYCTYDYVNDVYGCIESTGYPDPGQYEVYGGPFGTESDCTNEC